ncbi:MAG: Cobyrinic acid A,C-diamide synthase [Syntrophaceae bacterium PtaU1.Bin231]|nr:MAG: Cobyrinic acid A,C-diamide synthase [Syntrophaceae bacterium PtaU1.Bin231]
MKRPCPRLAIGGTHSGVGKTSLTLALVAALRRRGYRVQTFKVGPDFLDPSYLAIASGRPCYNLDGWMMGRKYVENLVARVTTDADMVVIEGVMGLFDGAKTHSLKGSTAEIAAWLRVPVVLVADVHGMARSLAATVKGYASFDGRVTVGGVIANRCGSDNHAALLSEALKASRLPPLMAAIPRGALPKLPSRHLGLVTADARNLSPQILDMLADAFERHAMVEEFLKLADTAPLLYDDRLARVIIPKRVRLGVAYDAAFHFYYQDFLNELERRGCELIRFSPISDTRLPDSLDALYFGGGYPEEMAADLSKNSAMRAAVKAFAGSGRPVYAECGGLMYLCRTLETADGTDYPMVGLLPAKTRMYPRIQSLSYTEVLLKEDSLWGKKGSIVRGHEFHYSQILPSPAGLDGWRSVYSARKRRSDIPKDEGFQKKQVLASYVHLYLASRPALLEHFIKTCEGGRT